MEDLKYDIETFTDELDEKIIDRIYNAKQDLIREIEYEVNEFSNEYDLRSEGSELCKTIEDIIDKYLNV